MPTTKHECSPYLNVTHPHHKDRKSVATERRKGKGCHTFSNSNRDKSTNIWALLIEDPWSTDNKQPPKTLNYDVVLPSPDKAKCATYIGKNLRYATGTITSYYGCILSIEVLINNRPKEIINIDAPNKVTPAAFLAMHRPPWDRLLAGAFHPHHTGWDGEKVAECDTVLRDSRLQADMLVEWTGQNK